MPERESRRNAEGTAPTSKPADDLKQVSKPVAKPRKRVRPMPARDADGNPICIVCDGPNDPMHPLSPYCAEDRRQVRRDTVRLSRERGEQADELIKFVSGSRQHDFQDGVYSGPAGIVLVGSKADELRVDFGLLAARTMLARSLTGGFKRGLGEEPYRQQLIALAEAAEDFNEILAPVLQRRRPRVPPQM